MSKKEKIDFIGNVLIGIVCPYLFLLSDNPYEVLYGGSEKNKNNKQLEVK